MIWLRNFRLACNAGQLLVQRTKWNVVKVSSPDIITYDSVIQFVILWGQTVTDLHKQRQHSGRLSSFGVKRPETQECHHWYFHEVRQSVGHLKGYKRLSFSCPSLAFIKRSGSVLPSILILFILCVGWFTTRKFSLWQVGSFTDNPLTQFALKSLC